MSRYDEITRDIQASLSASFWVKQAFKDLGERDVVDALNDVELLKDVLMVKWRELRGTN